MKLAVLFASAATTSAFVAPNRALSSSTAFAAFFDEDGEMSHAIPFAPRPELLDGSLPGDVGFDPFGLAGDDKDSLDFMREAEIKHARLAMLAAAGWPLAEVFHKYIASAIGLQPALTSTGQSPSVVNGGLDKIDIEYWFIVYSIAGIFECQSRMTKEANGDKYTHGDCGFDPLGFFPKNKDKQIEMQLKEIKHGRIAMMAILGFVVQEAIYNTPVVVETPQFFKPIFI